MKYREQLIAKYRTRAFENLKELEAFRDSIMADPVRVLEKADSQYMAAAVFQVSTDMVNMLVNMGNVEGIRSLVTTGLSRGALVACGNRGTTNCSHVMVVSIIAAWAEVLAELKYVESID